MSIPALPAGARFTPTQKQLLHYLKDKILNRLQLPLGIPDGYFADSINPYSCDPLSLPKGIDFNDFGEAFYFTQKPATRNVGVGYWDKLGWTESIYADDGQLLGWRQMFDFLWIIQGQQVTDNWVIHEYSVNPDIFSDEERAAAGEKIDNCIACVLCYLPAEEESEED